MRAYQQRHARYFTVRTTTPHHTTPHHTTTHPPRAVFLPVVFRPQIGLCGPEGAVRGAVQKSAEIPQLQVIKVVGFPVVTPRLIPTVLLTQRYPSCYLTQWSMPLFCRSCRFPVVVQRQTPMSDHRDSAVLLRQGDRCSVVQFIVFPVAVQS